MPKNYSLFVDDQNPGLRYLCPTVNQVVAGSYYNNTWSAPDSDVCEDGWWEYTFTGTAVQVFASSAHLGQSYSVKLDNGDFVPQSGNGSYVSPTLSDGLHTITYAMGPGNTTSSPAFDYLTVTAGPSTVLNGHAVVVDNQDSALTFTGNWNSTPPLDLYFDPSTSLFRNTTQWTSTIGDTVFFQFSGTSISVYGILANISTHGNITTSYSIDGSNTTSRSIGNGTFEFLPMIQLFSTDLPDGNHTLLMNITHIAPTQSLGVDFFTYNSTSTTPVGGIPSSGSVSGSSTPIWAPKVGIAIGVVAGFALLFGGFIIWWQRWRLRQPANLKHQRLDG